MKARGIAASVVVRLFAAAACVAVLNWEGAFAQAPSEHESHHPPPAADAPQPAPSPESPVTTEPADAPGGEGMGQMGAGGAGMGMGMGMEGMREGAARARELYPSMIQLRELTPENRAEIERLARERLSSGASLLTSGFEEFRSASAAEDLERIQRVVPRLRQGLDQVDSSAASLRALSEGQAPRAIALDWFTSSMNLPARDIAKPHGVFGLSAFHYFTMLLLGGTAAALLWMNLARVRRANALLARLASPAPAGTSPSPPSAASPAVSGAAAFPVALPPATEAPSRSNAWTGLLRVARIFEETPNVRTLRLVDPAGGEVPFRHLPGQFVTFTVRPVEQMVKRSYTIASSPTRRDYLEVTVKREEHGTVSSFLHGVHEGDTLQVTGPSGNFTFIGDGANSIVLISGGVGITPMMSVLRYLTDRSWSGEIYFIHGCKSDRDAIYRDELEYLRRRYPGLKLVIAASEASLEWSYARGQITAELLGAAVPYIHTRRIHLCGPPGMMTALKGMLEQLGVPSNQVKTEVFIGRERPVISPPEPADPREAPPISVSGKVEAAPPASTQPGAAPTVAVVSFARSHQTALLLAGKTVLDASEDVGVNIEYSCRIGVCGVCKVKLLSGSVTMEVEEGLDAGDRQKGLILACQAKSSADVSVDA